MNTIGNFLTFFVACILGVPAGIFTWLWFGAPGGFWALSLLSVLWGSVFGVIFSKITS